VRKFFLVAILHGAFAIFRSIYWVVLREWLLVRGNRVAWPRGGPRVNKENGSVERVAGAEVPVS
jgi:hypothetical protein